MRIVVLGLFWLWPLAGADWNAQAAADYLDARQKEWFAWKPANASGNGPCLSCHTGMTYLLARPALRRTLGQSSSTSYESGLIDAIRLRLPLDSPAKFAPKSKEPSMPYGVESILAALFLAQEERSRGSMMPEAAQALERMWAAQIRDGKDKGGWHWFSLDLEPWEEPASAFYGASVAAIAAGMQPAKRRAEFREQEKALAQYLRSRQADQPLHHRLMLAWASRQWKELFTTAERKEITAEVLRRQEPDGGWAMASLGPWHTHAAAPSQQGSNAYATAVAAFLLQKAGVKPSHGGMRKALAWLRTHQHAEGFWDAASMNKVYATGSMPQLFMRDAATAFAVMALTEAR